jgi:zinc and cadmium transporter
MWSAQMIWVYVIIGSLVGGILSLLIGILFISSKKEKIIEKYATAFAAGTLLSAAFLDLIPEALESLNSIQAMLFVMLGLIFFFLLEGILHCFHAHAHNECEECEQIQHKPLTLMIMVGDTLHNFMDGIAIASGFLISPVTGWLITLAVAIHEVPQEIGDIALMLSSGTERKKVIILNVVSSLVSVVSAVIFFGIGQNFNIPLAPFFAIIGGFFIYIASSDIIPTIHQEQNKKALLLKMIYVLLGAIILGLMIIFLGA